MRAKQIASRPASRVRKMFRQGVETTFTQMYSVELRQCLVQSLAFFLIILLEQPLTGIAPLHGH
jgi:hypothetical protein